MTRNRLSGDRTVSDNPNALDKTLLENADPNLKDQFLKLLKEQKDTHDLQKSHRCWFFVPSPAEYERMKRFAEGPDYDTCPKCKKGRIVVEIFRGNLGDSWHLVCKRWSDPAHACDFKEYISDDL
jgi:hypothetical protein